MDVLNISDPSTTAAPDILMSMPKIEFSWYDYGLFSVMLLGSMLIGIYFGFIKPQVTATDYLMGGKKMKVLPVALSNGSQITFTFTFTAEQDAFSLKTHYRSGTHHEDGSWSYSLQSRMQQFYENDPDVVVPYKVFSKHRDRIIERF
ncbi:lipase [Holotrichia oblita]|uniref:Lipase n=1 Tax=Holotrichia oblita TaxID=644536 RepID=A0ACB9T6U5_HOLOL|nr:lipase [Holotrichia oblita]